MEIRLSIYGLPQSGAFAKKGLKENLAPHGYFEVTHKPGFWQHIARSILFYLVVDDFAVKFVDKADTYHIIAALKTNNGIT